MNKPYIICHMMTSVDGRIDCAMTSQLPGVEDYYKTLDELNVPTTVSGRVTAELEMAEPGFFEAKNSETYTQEGFSKKGSAWTWFWCTILFVPLNVIPPLCIKGENTDIQQGFTFVAYTIEEQTVR